MAIYGTQLVQVKTLTSFKASQILVKLPEVDKVVFVVDRKDQLSNIKRVQ